MAAVEIGEEGGGLVPPGDVGIEVGAGEVLLAGDAHFFRGADEGVPDEEIEALGAGHVEGGLEVVPEGFLPMRADGGEAFGGDEGLAVGVGGGGGLLDEEAGDVGGAVAFCLCPELGGGNGGEAEGALGVDVGVVGAAGLGVDAEVVFLRAFEEGAVVVVDGEVAEGLAEVGEEALAGVAADDDVSC